MSVPPTGARQAAGREISPLTPGDLGRVAEIHFAAFPRSAMSALGIPALRRYYEWQLTGPHDAAALGVREGGELAAFCFGGVFRGAVAGFLRKNRGFLVLRVLSRPWLVANPLFRERLWLGVTLPLRLRAEKAAPPPPPRAPSFGILSIAVDPRFEGRGLGRVLMEEMESIARQRGFPAMNLTVDPENGRAVGFYERLGWRRDGAPAGWKGKMVKPLVSGSAADGSALQDQKG